MKKMLTVLVFLLPAISRAQLLEMSLKGGVVPNTLPKDRYFNDAIEKPISIIGSFSATVGLPKGIRVGASISAYNLEYSAISGDLGIVEPRSYHKYGNPILPVELVVLKRGNFSSLRLDMGLTGGMSVTTTMRSSYDNNSSVYERKAKKPWYTIGFVGSAQFDVTKRIAVGAEIQVKWLRIGTWASDNIFLAPMMLKASVRI